MKCNVGEEEISIFFRHDREEQEDGSVSNYGGTTEAYIFTKDGVKISGRAECSVKDNYCKQLGRIIATGRLFKELGLDTKEAIRVARCK